MYFVIKFQATQSQQHLVNEHKVLSYLGNSKLGLHSYMEQNALSIIQVTKSAGYQLIPGREDKHGSLAKLIDTTLARGSHSAVLLWLYFTCEILPHAMRSQKYNGFKEYSSPSLWYLVRSQLCEITDHYEKRVILFPSNPS